MKNKPSLPVTFMTTSHIFVSPTTVWSTFCPKENRSSLQLPCGNSY